MNKRKVDEYLGIVAAVMGVNILIRMLELGVFHWLFILLIVILFLYGMFLYAYGRKEEDRVPKTLYQATRNMNTAPVEAALSSNDPAVIKNGLEHAKSVLDTLKDLSRGAGD